MPGDIAGHPFDVIVRRDSDSAIGSLARLTVAYGPVQRRSDALIGHFVS